MSAYRTVVVGTDGSGSSLEAVTRAGALAGACGAPLVIVCAYLPTAADDRELSRAQESLGPDAVQVVGSAPAEGRLGGSVPADVTRRSGCDVLVVHTTG